MKSDKPEVPAINERDYEFMLKVKEAYEKSQTGQGGSIRAAAAEFNLSRTKVRKILITLGVIESDITEKALSLKNQGRSLKDIADTLECSVATVSTYLPYDTVIYNGEEKSSGAVRLELYRERNKLVADRQTQRTGRTAGEINNTREDWNNPVKENDIMKKREFKVLKLRLSLDIEDADMEVLKKYGKVKEGITRDVLVPADMNLHALHYVIQKAFGWQNSHLHHFMLPKDIYDDLTKNSFMKWADYCGIYFRFPTDDLEDIYWDDDYDESVSPRTWMRRKYTGTYQYRGISEHFMEARNKAESFIAENKKVRITPSFSEWLDKSDEEREELIQHLKLKNIEEATCEEMNRTLIDIGGIEELLERLYLKEIFGEKADDAKFSEMVKDADRRFSENTVDEYGYKYLENMTRLNGTALPVTNELEYEYDYGDGWKVKIEVLDEYYSDDSCDNPTKSGSVISETTEDQTFDDKTPIYNNGEMIEGELRDQIAAVISQRRPLCIAIDGLPVLDDVGGVYGYCEMLNCIRGKDCEHYNYDDPEETKEWARMMGWTGRMNKPETLL